MNKTGIRFFQFLTVVLVSVQLCSCEKEVVKGTVADFEGNVYKTVKIGTQWWMAENLKTTRYLNGDQIETTNPANLNSIVGPNQNYQWAYDGSEINAATYGRLYTWHAVNDSRNVCPEGWHVPTDTEWHTLVLYLDNSSSLTLFESTVAGGKLKEAGTTHWLNSNNGATNESGFTALPGGFRYNNGSFYNLGVYGIWWSSTECLTNDGNAVSRALSNTDSSVGRDENCCKADGYSVRCLKY